MTADSRPSVDQNTAPKPALLPVEGSTISDRIDKFLQWLKWPAAIVALLLTPLVLWALGRLLGTIVMSPSFSLIPFIAGMIGFAFLWRKWLGQSRWGSFLITLEHESTHALFALLTWHSIVGFRASLGQGGEVRFAGKGNWLITASPYFFPTAAILFFLIAFFLPFAALPWQSFLLGVAVAYHGISTYRETHRDQSDLKLLGKSFCWSFLPAANIVVIGVLLAFSYAGNDGVRSWFGFAQEFWTLFWNFIWQASST
ncbi:MAG: hypothetical protein U0930_01530 [Pirellulales bacterium]